MERKQMIMKRVQEHYDYLITNGYNVAFVALQGSQNYELDLYIDNYMSDIDTKAVIIPTLKDIVSGRAPLSTTLILDNNEHIDLKDIRLMNEMFKKQNVSYLELLFTEFKVVNPDFAEITNDLYANAEKVAAFNHIAFFKGIKGMALEKQKALYHPYPNTMDKIEKFGYDPKQLHHIARLYEMVVRLEHGETLVNCWVARERFLLLDIKIGLYPLWQAEQIAEEGVNSITKICDRLAAEDRPIDCTVKPFLDEIALRYIEKSIRQELALI
jgi:hypothetical protein